LNLLEKRTDIVIRKSDKGDKITVETRERYISDGLNHLNNEEVYHRLDKDINHELHESISKFLKHSLNRGIINQDLFNFLNMEEEPRTPLIYFLKKLHKTPIAVRPIVSNIHSPTCNLSALMDILLKPIVAQHEHILKNSTQVILELEQLHIPPNSLLVTADVSSLYPSIPIEHSIDVIIDFIDNHNDPTYPPVCFLRNVLLFVLKYNCFNFADLFFLQVRGVAMGTRMAPNYANLYMAYLEKEHIFTYPKQPLYYRRYLDDIILIWPGPLEELTKFQEYLNNAHPTIKFTFEISTSNLPYLDINIHIENGRAFVSPYFKGTNTFSYIRGDSYHPPSIYGAIITGENNRILRNSSKEDSYQTTMTMLKNKFENRKFPRKFIERPIIPFEDRNIILQGSTRDNQGDFVTIVCKYDKTLPIKSILTESWGIFANNEDTRRSLLTKQLRVSHTLGTNIGRRITKTRLEGTIDIDTNTYEQPEFPKISWPAKNIQCRVNQCGTCNQLSSNAYYYSFQTKIRYPIENIYSCDTVGAIYLLDCKICGKQYIGETGTTLRIRIRRHRNKQNIAFERPIYDHLKKHGTTFDTFKITVIDQVPDVKCRKAKEAEYIQVLKTKVPFGLNVIKNKQP